MPSQTFSHEATTDAPVETVWAKLDQPETWESIGGVDRVFDPEIDEQGRLLGFSFDTVAAGKRYIGLATPEVRVEGETMAWAIQNQEIRGSTRVDLEKSEGGTTIAVTLQVESVGLLSSMLFPIIAGAIGNGVAKSVDAFAAGLGD